jgi:ribosomal protein L16 Arg81 hydroxylase
MIWTLQTLIAPLTETEFRAHLLDRTVAFVRTTEPDRFETLLDWNGLNYLIESGLYPIDGLRVCEAVPIPRSVYIKEGRVDPASLLGLMDRGAGLIFNRLDKYVSGIWRLCHQIAEQIGEEVTAEALVTSEKGGVRRQTNAEDICVLQIAGSLRWELCSPRTLNPPEGMSVQVAPQGLRVFNEILTAGDFLFVPGGFLRRWEGGPGRSLHLCMAFDPPCGQDVVTSIASELAEDETFNRPLTRHDGTSELAAHEAALKARLIDQVQALSLARFLAERAAAASKAVRIHIQGTEQANDDEMGHNPAEHDV